MAKRPLQEINAGSMADIAFLLLIFFLVTTTMSTNTGMQRKLPPLPKEDEKKDVPMLERNVMIVLINKDNQIGVGGNPIHISQLCEKTKLFFKNSNNAPNLPEKTTKDIELLGKFDVSKGVVSLQHDRVTSYEKYLQVQNELAKAVSELRDELSKERFGAHYDDLSSEKQKAIDTAYPSSISEAEPRAIVKD